MRILMLFLILSVVLGTWKLFDKHWFPLSRGSVVQMPGFITTGIRTGIFLNKKLYSDVFAHAANARGTQWRFCKQPQQLPPFNVTCSATYLQIGWLKHHLPSFLPEAFDSNLPENSSIMLIKRICICSLWGYFSV